MPTPLEQSIHRTATWFSIFETPVTVFELWKWMLEPDRPYSLEETHAALEGSWLRERLAEAGGLWVLRPAKIPTPGVGILRGAPATESQPRGLALERRERFLDATRKFKKLCRAMRYVSLVPGVTAVGAGNTLAWWNTRPDSDIDLLVVTRPGMLWIARLLVVTPFALLGKRPGAAAVDPFCFSFFVSEDAIGFSSLRLDGNDPYFAYWTRSLVPVIDRGGIFDRIAVENGWVRGALKNGWASDRVPGSGPCARHRSRSARSLIASTCERIARAIQLRRFPDRIRGLMNVDSRVVANDRVLKFHENDRRAEYRDRLSELHSLDA